MTILWTTTALAPLVTVLALAMVGLQRSDPAGDRARARLTWVAPWTTLPGLVLALAGPAAGGVDLPGLLLGTALEVDGLARPLLLAVCVIYLAALWSVAARRAHRSPLLAAILLVCYLGNVGALVAADVVTFYTSFAVMSFAAYGLVVHRGTAAARRAGRVYLVLTVVSEVLVLVALMFVVTAGGLRLADAPAAVASSPYTTLVVVLLLLGFGIKAGTVPLHVWVAPAYGQAPPAGAAVLSGALSKVGIVGFLRFLPLGEAQLPSLGWVLASAGLVGMFGAVVAGVLHSDGRTALAYSSVSQLGLLTLLVGAALLEPGVAPACVVAATMYIVHHGLAKATLFLGVPLWRSRGAARAWVRVGSTVAALGIAGAPLTAGFLAKYAVKEAVHDVPGLATALTVLGVGSTLVLARALWLLHRPSDGVEEGMHAVDVPEGHAPGPKARPAPPGARPGGSPRSAIAAWAVLAVAAAVLPWLVGPAWLPDADRPDLTLQNLWEAGWPVLLGVMLAGTAWWLGRRVPRLADPPVVPAGDLLVPAEAVVAAVVRGGRRGVAASARGYARVRDGAVAAIARVSLPAAAVRGEARLGAWRASGVALLIVATAVLVVGWWA